MTFANRFNIDIDTNLSVTSRDNQHFVLAKDDVYDMMFFFSCKHKFEIFKIIVNLKTYVKTQKNCKLKRIRADYELFSKEFDA